MEMLSFKYILIIFFAVLTNPIQTLNEFMETDKVDNKLD